MLTERQRREVEQARRLLQSPRFQLAVNSWQRSQGAALAKSVTAAFAPQYQRWLQELSVSVFPVRVPPLKIDYASLFPDFSRISAEALKPAMGVVKRIQEIQREQFAGALAAARRPVQAALPPNWVTDEIRIPEDLETLLLDEGLPLAWVPPPDVLIRLFSARTLGDRRRIIGSRWKRLAQACIDELKEIDGPDLSDHVHFAQRAAEMLLSGSHEGCQALSANLLDTVLRAQFTNESRRTVTDQRARFDIESYPLRVAIVLGGIWGAYGEFWPSNGDSVPRSFSRHGSAHGVSRRQYSRVNAVVALMHVVALLRLVENDLAGPR